MSRPIWTQEETAYLLIRRQAGDSLIDIAQALKKPIGGVRHKSSRLNAGVTTTRKGWSRIEVRRLIRLYPKGQIASLGQAFPGRSAESLQRKAAKLGLVRARRADAIEELGLLASLSERQAAYIAGLVDGEGSITRNRGCARFSLGLTSEPAIRWLAQVTGGSFREVKVGPNRKRFWVWTLSKERAVAALYKRLSPYLLIKAWPP